jgi:hypothetical protein
MSQLDLSERDLATLSGCSFESADGRCGSQDFGTNPHPQGSLGVLYNGYYAAQGLNPPLEPAPLALAVSNAMNAAGCGGDDHFCAEHADEMDHRLCYELAREVGEPQMGVWLASPEAAKALLRSRLSNVEMAASASFLAAVDIPTVDLSDLDNGF